MKFGRKIEIQKYLEAVGNPFAKIAYSPQQMKTCPQFVSMLLRTGFQINFGEPACPIMMGLDIAGIIDQYDEFIIGSNHAQMLPILAWIRKRNRRAKCFACNIPASFRQYAECIEIQEEILDAAAT